MYASAHAFWNAHALVCACTFVCASWQRPEASLELFLGMTSTDYLRPEAHQAGWACWRAPGSASLLPSWDTVFTTVLSCVGSGGHAQVIVLMRQLLVD